MKQQEKRVRQRYIQELERFTNRIVSFCSKECTKEEFSAYIDKIFEPLQNIEKIHLKNDYLKELESYVERTANLPRSDLDIDAICSKTKQEANALRKLKRKRKYSRQR